MRRNGDDDSGEEASKPSPMGIEELGGVIAPLVRGMSETLLRRRVKTYNQATGEPVRDVTMRQLVGGLAKVTALEIEVIDGRRPDAVLCEECGKEVKVPKSGGTPKHCGPKVGGCKRQAECAGGCGKKPSKYVFKPRAIAVRKGDLWRCNECIPPEQRSEAARKANASKTPEERSEAARKGQASKTPEERSEAARKGQASKTPEERSEAARKANASRTPEQRSEAVRKGNATRNAREEAAQ